MYPAFVIKNYVPDCYKVLILHQLYGKIFCKFFKKDQATLLTTGSVIWCSIEKTSNLYQFLQLDIESQIMVKDIFLVHSIMKFCLEKVPKEIAVPELFDFLLYVQSHKDQFDEKACCVVILRMFLMFDLIGSDLSMHKAASLDPTGPIDYDIAVLKSYVAYGWHNF